MSPNDIEKYKKDMMKMYGKRAFVDDITEKKEEKEEKKEEEQEIKESKKEEIAENKENEEDKTDEINELDERFPEPDLLSELESEEYPTEEYTTEESMGNSTGYILVNVRAGHDAYPIVNASVIVTAIVGGNRLIISSGNTDISGATIKMKAPAPDSVYSQSPDSEVRPYSLFDVSVVANGYFNARSVDVPVFSGITSIQNFNMIPVPLLMKSSDETLTYFNQEPDYR